MEYLRKFNPDTTYTPKEGHPLYDLHQKAIKGLPLTKEEKRHITNSIINSSDIHGTTIKLLGWEFDFSPILHRILVYFSYGRYEVFYAINKTYLKEQLSSVSKMTYIDCDGKVKKPYD